MVLAGTGRDLETAYARRVEIVVRPRRHRLRRPTRAIAIIAAVFLVCTAGAAVNHVGTDVPVHVPYLAVAVALVAVPFLLLLAFLVMNRRNVFLRWADGRLALGEWTGRRVEVDQPQSVRVFPVAGSPLLVVAGGPAEPAIVLNPGWWAEEDLDRLLSTIGVPVTQAPDSAVFPGINRAYPGSRLPFSVRHPALFVIGLFGTIVVWLFAMTFLVTHL
jgi:hypothetical protein